jgi:hypothetical protein
MTMTAGGQVAPVPRKYVSIGGVMQLNPEYKRYTERVANPDAPPTSVLNPERALPVVSSMEDHAQLRAVSTAAGQGEIPLAPSMDATIEIVQTDPWVSKAVGLAPDAIVDALGKTFTRKEIPMGLMNKLMGLSETYRALEFIVDDSGSMSLSASPAGSRWAEARSRLDTMLEILALVPTPEIVIRFLNRSDTVTFQRKGETPEIFFQNAKNSLDRAFREGPAGGTPVLNCLQNSFTRSAGQRVARYLFCDGVPTGGAREVNSIANLLKSRRDPEGNPFTLLACSDQEDDVKWMGEVEEVAAFCSAYDDFESERQEVAGDQGPCMPYSKGFYLICQLVGAMNPNDLDAMDESTPFTKATLDNLLGYQSSEQDFRRYFDGFLEAQRKRTGSSPSDLVKNRQSWEPSYREFLAQPSAGDIAAVSDYRERLRRSEEARV